MNTDAERWLRQAERDLESAESNYQTQVWYVCAFLAQQAAEKALKAVLAERTGGPPPRLHSIQKLGDLTGLTQQLPPEALRLDDYYISARYPDAVTGLPYESLGERDALTALNAARKTVAIAQGELGGNA